MSVRGKCVSWRLAEWVAGGGSQDIPAQLRVRAGACVTDTVGVAIAGARSNAATIARSLCSERGGRGWSTVFGSTHLFPAQAAAFANGTAAHALDFDDNCYAGFVHGSAVVAPAVLALGQQVDMTGADAITAFIVGSECEYAVGAATQNVLYERGWWSTGVLGPIGSSMAAARILGLDAEKTHAALGLALVNASGMKACFGSDAKALMAGRASELGVVCAELAAKGASGPERPLDGENGFIDLFNEKVFDDTCLSALGQRWYMASPGVDTKRMPVCLSSHAAVDAVLDIVEKHGLSLPDIKSIVCDVPPIVRANLKYQEPKTPQEALFSMPFAIAASLRFGTLSLSHLGRETLEDEGLAALMARVSMVSGPAWNDPDIRVSAPEGALVRVEMRDGAFFEAFLDKARGSAAYPLSAGQVADKFLACAAPVLGSGRAGSLLADLGQMDTSIPLREIFRRADVGVFT